MSAKEANLAAAPEGFRYEIEVVPPDEERGLVRKIREVPLKEFEFHGYIAKRRVKSFGWSYDFETEKLMPADPIPEFLIPVREIAARFANVPPEELESIGTGIKRSLGM